MSHASPKPNVKPRLCSIRFSFFLVVVWALSSLLFLDSAAQTNREPGPETNSAPAGTNVAPAGTNVISAKTNAPDAPPEAVSGFTAFKLINERNIFNQNRSRPGAPRSTARPEAEKKVQVDSFTLSGTLIYSKGAWAAFTGSSAEYRKLIKEGEKIAGYTVKNIGYDGAVIENGTVTNKMAVGAQMRREDQGEWNMIASPIKSQMASSTNSASSEAAVDEDSEILKKLMQKREQEMNNAK